MNLFGCPATDGVAAVQERLQQPDDPCVVDLDSGIADGPDAAGQGQPLEEREIRMNVEVVRPDTGEAVGDDLEAFAHGVEMIQPFLQAEIAQLAA